jgi:hypothetical protein
LKKQSNALKALHQEQVVMAEAAKEAAPSQVAHALAANRAVMPVATTTAKAVAVATKAKRNTNICMPSGNSNYKEGD